MKKIILTVLLSGSLGVSAQQIIPLYEGTVPNSKPSEIKEVTTNNGFYAVSNVSVPTLAMYKPAKQSPLKSAVIICPGGGYGVLAMGHEGVDVAKALNDMGVTAFILKYRLPNDAIMKDKSIAPLQDLQQAFKLVREHAKEWNINTQKLGVMGFSAGGHLAATASTQFNREVIDNPKNTSLRPDFSVLIYPVISFTDKLKHMGSRENLIGRNPSEALIRQYSNELQVTKNTPPTFLVHAADDSAVPIGNSRVYKEALIKNGVACEMVTYLHGEHGFGMNNPTTTDKWMDDLKKWLIAGKWL
ncbi:1,4-beta-xylanase [Flavobacterium psychrophilum]|nr:1,4-beta-xylanase [Flavobacterium psychrophilum]AOE53985.1 1,4-beta-xylanase [Flavobacterium psychrophilum]